MSEIEDQIQITAQSSVAESSTAKVIKKRKPRAKKAAPSTTSASEQQFQVLFPKSSLENILRAQSLIMQGQQLLASAWAEAHAHGVEISAEQLSKLNPAASVENGATASSAAHDQHATDTESTEVEEVNHKKPVTKKRQRKPLEEGHPKRLSGYLLFCQHMRQQIDRTQFANQSQITTHMGQEWSKLAQEEKDALNARAKAMYDDEMRVFELKKQQQQSSQHETEHETEGEEHPPSPVLISTPAPAAPVKVSVPAALPTPATVSAPSVATVPSSSPAPQGASASEAATEKSQKEKKHKKKDKENKDKHKKKKHKHNKSDAGSENAENVVPANN